MLDFRHVNESAWEKLSEILGDYICSIINEGGAVK